MSLYSNLCKRLTALYDSSEAQSIVRLVLDSKFGLSLTDIVCGGIENLSDSQKADLEDIIHRIEGGEPVQYVLGEAWFYGRKFHVAPGVLIPRPETEQLCNIIIKDQQSDKTAILDIGTGSGCIAITLALEIPDSNVTAIDVSDDALSIAKGNARNLGTEVAFDKQDILHLPPLCGGPGKCFSLIVSNPPYIIESERKDMRQNVLEHEPDLALFVPDNDPLRFYRAIADYAVSGLRNGGMLYFEINPLFSDELKEMMEDKGFTDVEIIDDDYGKHRFAKGVKRASGSTQKRH